MSCGNGSGRYGGGGSRRTGDNMKKGFISGNVDLLRVSARRLRAVLAKFSAFFSAVVRGVDPGRLVPPEPNPGWIVDVSLLAAPVGAMEPVMMKDQGDRRCRKKRDRNGGGRRVERGGVRTDLKNATRVARLPVDVALTKPALNRRRTRRLADAGGAFTVLVMLCYVGRALLVASCARFGSVSCRRRLRSRRVVLKSFKCTLSCYNCQDPDTWACIKYLTTCRAPTVGLARGEYRRGERRGPGCSRCGWYDVSLSGCGGIERGWLLGLYRPFSAMQACLRVRLVPGVRHGAPSLPLEQEYMYLHLVFLVADKYFVISLLVNVKGAQALYRMLSAEFLLRHFTENLAQIIWTRDDSRRVQHSFLNSDSYGIMYLRDVGLRTRRWRRSYPVHFSELTGDQTPLQRQFNYS
ncbi:hypothetical protein BKA93DRAFT_882467 [Sparassis latifolia]